MNRGVAQSGSAPAWGVGGRRFKSSRPDHKIFFGKNVFCFLIFIVSIQISACGTETNPKKAFNKGDYKTSFTLFRKLAKNGDTEAQNYLGIHYSLGLSTERDYEKAYEWYKKAAKAGHPDAQRNIADMHNYGRGVKKDSYLAFVWYFAAYQQGNENAKPQFESIAASGHLSPNQQLHAKIDSNNFIIDKKNHFISYDTYIKKE
tara:strand:- start:474 stop:1082 length:609 start_codon:yes stop_codon:yes gene_type:complete